MIFFLGSAQYLVKNYCQNFISLFEEKLPKHRLFCSEANFSVVYTPDLQYSDDLSSNHGMELYTAPKSSRKISSEFEKFAKFIWNVKKLIMCSGNERTFKKFSCDQVLSEIF